MSFHHRTKRPAMVDGLESLPASVHRDGTRLRVIAIPTAQPGHDPTRPRETSDGMRVLLSLGAALKRRTERLDRIDLGFAVDGRGRQTVFAVAFLNQLHVDTGGLD